MIPMMARQKVKNSLYVTTGKRDLPRRPRFFVCIIRYLFPQR